ncbi:MAG: hypothetical protein WC291_10310 [Thermodesulfovibrionales bacterium]|jgi:hypothetical protein
MTTVEDICRDFPEWPESWMGFDKDVPYGKGINDIFRPFIESLIAKGLTRKTIKRHCDNLWLLGGEIIREVNTNNRYKRPPMELVMEEIGPDGGAYCEHLDTEDGMKSYDATCRALYNFLK